jgi:hypothetical protein
VPRQNNYSAIKEKNKEIRSSTVDKENGEFGFKYE